MMTTVISKNQFLRIRNKTKNYQDIYYCTDCTFKNVIFFGNLELAKTNTIYRKQTTRKKKLVDQSLYFLSSPKFTKNNKQTCTIKRAILLKIN